MARTECLKDGTSTVRFPLDEPCPGIAGDRVDQPHRRRSGIADYESDLSALVSTPLSGFFAGP
jgi:hypothetical protein